MTTQELLREGRFTLDVFEESQPDALRLFAGFTLGERWNGWACPYFTYEQAQKLVTAWQAIGAVAHYDLSRDEFVFGSLEPNTEEEPERCRPLDIAGQTLYPIGTRGWTWDEVKAMDFEEGTLPK